MLQVDHINGLHHDYRPENLRFQCPNCGLGDGELGHLMDEADTYCIVCLEELGRLIRIECWGEGKGPQARFRASPAAA